MPAPQPTAAFGDSRLPPRFWSHVRIDAATGCWIWSGPHNGLGYGTIYLATKKRRVYAHRLCYEVLVGTIRSETLDHVAARGCVGARCVNPGHLEQVSLAENIRRGKGFAGQNARKTHCKYGHELSGKNLVLQPQRGSRQCRQCQNRRMRECASRKRKEAKSNGQ